MNCPYCSNRESKVVDKRDNDNTTRRRRECLKCEKRFTTHERVEQLNIVIIKKNGEREQFDRTKIKHGMARSCEKRISDEELDAIVDKIERDIKRLKTMEVPSVKIGALVMKYLKKVDDIAYLRFASVYQNFQDAKEFKEELKKLTR